MVITQNSNNFWVITRIFQSFPVLFPMLPLEMKSLNGLLNYTLLVSSVYFVYVDNQWSFGDKMVINFFQTSSELTKTNIAIQQPPGGIHILLTIILDNFSTLWKLMAIPMHFLLNLDGQKELVIFRSLPMYF